MGDCKHDDIYWYCAVNETGWKCVCGWQPGEEPGYSPEHDRDRLDVKVWSILHDLVDAKILYVSNSSHGEGVVEQAASICRDARTLDQKSIAAVLCRILAGDGKFWRERHEGILAGKDPRSRCYCGKLASSYSGGHAFCRDHGIGWKGLADA